MIMEILEIKCLGCTLEHWLLINFSLGAVWALLRLFNVGLVRYTYHLAMTEDYPLIIEPDAEDIDKRLAMILYFLFGLPKTIIFFIIVAMGIVFVVAILALTTSAAIIIGLFWLIKWGSINLKQMILRFVTLASALG